MLETKFVTRGVFKKVYLSTLVHARLCADDCMDAGGRITQEQLSTTAWMQEVE